MSSSSIQINSNKEVIEAVASSEKIKKELGWVPQITSLEKMIVSVYEWKQKFPEGYSL